MKLTGFTSRDGKEVGIPAAKITGFICVKNHACGNCYIATGADGADGADGGENGFYVQETYREVWMMLESVEA